MCDHIAPLPQVPEDDRVTRPREERDGITLETRLCTGGRPIEEKYERFRGGAVICRGSLHYAVEGGAQDASAEDRERIANVADCMSGQRLWTCLSARGIPNDDGTDLDV